MKTEESGMEMSIAQSHDGVMYHHTLCGRTTQWSRCKPDTPFLSMPVELLEPRQVPPAVRDAFWRSSAGQLFAHFLKNACPVDTR